MANYCTHLAFEVTADAGEAERFNRVLEEAGVAGAGIGEDDDQLDGVACRLDSETGRLAICDSDGAPNLWALAKALQRLLPARMPFGFVYSCSCDKARCDGFGGGLFAIGAETIVHRDLGELLAEEIAGLGEICDAG
jgi:hypothetical protein